VNSASAAAGSAGGARRARPTRRGCHNTVPGLTGVPRPARRPACRGAERNTGSRGSSEPSIQPLRPASPAAAPLTDLIGQPITDPFASRGSPGSTAVGRGTLGLRRPRMQERGIPVHLPILRCARLPRRGRQPARRVRTRRRRLRPAAEGLRKMRSRVLPAGSSPPGSTQRNISSCYGRTRVTTSWESRRTAGTASTPRASTPNDVGEINHNIDTMRSEQFPTSRAKSSALGPNAFPRARGRRPDVLPREEWCGGRGRSPRPTANAASSSRRSAAWTADQPLHRGDHRLLVRMAGSDA